MHRQNLIGTRFGNSIFKLANTSKRCRQHDGLCRNVTAEQGQFVNQSDVEVERRRMVQVGVTGGCNGAHKTSVQVKAVEYHTRGPKREKQPNEVVSTVLHFPRK